MSDATGLHGGEMTLSGAAERLAEDLAAAGTRLVLAESCTGGLAAAALAALPGISQWWCGSAVTYRDLTKVAWLGVSPADLERVTAVSPDVAAAMARGVLERTAEADVAASITGHLGPDAPAECDGQVWIGLVRRERGGIGRVEVFEHRLRSSSRTARQLEAAVQLLSRTGEAVRSPGPSPAADV
jgi:PncC family amidohydrolase